jgi:hypothetical protein
VKGFGFVAVEGDSTDGTGVKGFDRKTGTGVDGHSDSGVGVRGTSDSGDGVVGSTPGLGKSGVFGFNSRDKDPGFGVTGISDSRDGAGVNGFSDIGVGVKGNSNKADGVVGSSRGDGRSGVFGRNTVEAEGTGFGVSGTSNSRAGAGVNGFSVGYGGQFRGDRAPLRLEPAGTAGHPTAASGAHQRGELYVDVKGDLFFCRDDGTPGTWFRVQLTPA